MLEHPVQSTPYIVSFGLQYLMPNSLKDRNTSGLSILSKLYISLGLPSIGVPDNSIIRFDRIIIGNKCYDLLLSLDLR